MLCSFINSLVEQYNSVKKIELTEAFSNIIQNECISAFNHSHDFYNVSLKNFFCKDEPLRFNEIHEILQKIRETTLEKYHQIAKMNNQSQNNQFYLQYKQKLIEYIDGKQQMAFDLNRRISQSYNEEIFQTLIAEIKINTADQENLTAQDFADEFESLYQGYQEKTVGPEKLSVFMKNFFEHQNNFLKEIQQKNQSELQKERQQYKSQKQNLKQIFNQQDQELNSLTKTIEQLEKDIKDHTVQKTQLEQEASLIQDQINQLNQNLKVDQTQIKTLDAKKTKLNTEIANLKEQQQLLNQNVNQVEGSIQQLKLELQILQQKKKGGCCIIF
eukprot:TRINITY_DN5110_c0_g1_i1.p1 TRINITY_DN5110_c0_g1~~TRINITY_DN5110_c0_g1_i1.p1  ORF type:complete len:329 (+),score=50.22 TRINITY_DN5110_c0_g1_i1:2031-3017(+)